MLEVQGPRGRAMAQRTWIHHNYFYNFENSRRNNSSALHTGHSCNKSFDNIYRFNTIGEGCTELSLRHGNRCLVYGNFLIGTRGGLRFYGDDHRIFSNYFQLNRPAVQIVSGGANVPPAELTSHDRPDRVQFVFNTLMSIDGLLPDATWQGNVVWGIEDEVGDIPPSGYTSIDPHLQKGAGEIYRLGSGSAVIGRAIGSYPYVKVPVNRILTSVDVGPSAP